MDWCNRFLTLPAQFYTRLPSTPLPHPHLIDISAQAAQLIGVSLAQLHTPAWQQALAGNGVMAGMAPYSAVYSGHQFGVWAGQLGDGRAITLGELHNPVTAQSWEIQLKGSGATPYSRRGDGRAVLRSSVREYLCSEAMHALGVPTTRALSLMGSSQAVIREKIETAAVVARLAPSFIRFGSFEHWYAKNDIASLKILADFVIEHFYPEALTSSHPYQFLLQAVTLRTAKLMAHWQAVGFMHGVMNTDNLSILGITLDYGPFGMMESYDATHICNHTDSQGRYAFNQQPQVGLWNCAALAQALLPLFPAVGAMDAVEAAQATLALYQAHFDTHYKNLMLAKLGLSRDNPQADSVLAAAMALLTQHRVDYSLFFRRLANVQNGASSDTPQPGVQALCDLFIERAACLVWLADYWHALQNESTTAENRARAMNAVNPKFILRNYLAQTAIERAEQGDFSEIKTLMHILSQPFDEHITFEHYAQLPPDWASGLEVSCSS